MEFYSIAEAAQMSGQSQKTIRRHIAAGKLKADKIGNCYRITKENYNKWLLSDLDPEKDNIFNEGALVVLLVVKTLDVAKRYSQKL